MNYINGSFHLIGDNLQKMKLYILFLLSLGLDEI